MEDTAQQIICNAKEHEREALPKLDQTYIELYSELEQLRAPIVFDQLIGKELCYVDINKSHVYVKYASGYGHFKNTAICNHVMRAGKHYATFTKEGEYMYWNVFF